MMPVKLSQSLNNFLTTMSRSVGKVSSVKATSPGEQRTADRVVTSHQESESRKVHNDVPHFPHVAIPDESNHGSSNARQASAKFTAELRDSQALRETDDVSTVEQGRRVQAIAVQPSTSKRQGLRSADHLNSDGASQAFFQSVRDKVAPTIGGNRKDNREAIAETDRHVRHQDTSTTDLQPDRAMRGMSVDAVYKVRIVEKIVHVDRVVSVPVYKDKIVETIVHVQVPQVSDLDMAVQAAKYLEHTLRVNFSATGDGLGQCMRSAAMTHGRFEKRLWNSMLWIYAQRNAIVHQAETNQIPDRRIFMKKFKFVWSSLKKISRCRDYCEVCNRAGLLFI